MRQCRLSRNRSSCSIPGLLWIPCNHRRNDPWSHRSKRRNFCGNTDCRNPRSDRGNPGLYSPLLYICDRTCLYLYKIPQSLHFTGNSGFPSSCCCCHDRKGRRFHSYLCLLYKRGHFLCTGKYFITHGALLCRCTCYASEI